MKPDRYRKIRESDLPIMQEWARKISGIQNLTVVIADKDAGDDPQMVAWIVTANPPIIHLDRKALSSNVENVTFFRVYMLHEVGHLLTDDAPGNNEYHAHKWAIQKAQELGLIYELRLLQGGCLAWLHQHAKKDRTYNQAAKLLLKEGLL